MAGRLSCDVGRRHWCRRSRQAESEDCDTARLRVSSPATHPARTAHREADLAIASGLLDAAQPGLAGICVLESRMRAHCTRMPPTLDGTTSERRAAAFGRSNHCQQGTSCHQVRSAHAGNGSASALADLMRLDRNPPPRPAHDAGLHHQHTRVDGFRWWRPCRRLDSATVPVSVTYRGLRIMGWRPTLSRELARRSGWKVDAMEPKRGRLYGRNRAFCVTWIHDPHCRHGAIAGQRVPLRPSAWRRPPREWRAEHGSMPNMRARSSSC